MKKTLTIGEQSFEIRGLKWGEKKQLKREGHDILALDPNKDNDELIEHVVKMASFNNAEIDTLDVIQVYQLFAEIIQLSFVAEKDAKN